MMNGKEFSHVSQRWSNEWSRLAAREKDDTRVSVIGVAVSAVEMEPRLLVSQPMNRDRVEWFLRGEQMLLNGHCRMELAGVEPDDIPYSSDCQLMMFGFEQP
jgi:lysine/ornithine N-monooxygenase